MTEIQRLANAIKVISETYLGRVVARDDKEAIAKWSMRLADYSSRLAVLVSPHAALAQAEVADLNPVEAPPNYGVRQEMSSGLYGDWVSAWVQRRFPEAYRDWPPTVHAITPQALLEAAKADGCLAQVTATGNFGEPDGPWAGVADFSLYTALTGTNTDDGQFLHKVWHMGELVGEKSGGPDIGLDFAESLGFDW